MISSPLSHDDQEELLKEARANVGLIADTIWAPLDHDDPYRKLNRNLWIRSGKIASDYTENSSVPRAEKKRVRDVIPESRLARYGDYEYGEDETIRESDDDHDDKITDEKDNRDKTDEPWMLPEVEEYIARLKRTDLVPLLEYDEAVKDLQKSTNKLMKTEEKTTSPEAMEKRYSPPPRFSVTNVSEAQLEGRVFNETVRSLWGAETPGTVGTGQSLSRDLLERELELLRPHQAKRPISDVQHTHSNFQTERLRMPTWYHYTYVQTSHRPLAPLCVDVPEFFPKGPGNWPNEDQTKSSRVYPDNPYRDVSFPYKSHATPRKPVAVYQNTLIPMVPTPLVSAIVWPSQVWAQRLLPTPFPMQQMAPTGCSVLPAPPQQMAMQQQQQSVSQVMSPTVAHRPIRIQESKGPIQQIPKPLAQVPLYQRQNKPAPELSQKRKSQGVDFSNLILLTKSAMKVRRNQSKSSKKAFDSNKSQTNVLGKCETGSKWFDKSLQSQVQRREREYVTVKTATSRIPEEEPTKLEAAPTRKRLYWDVAEKSEAIEDTGFELRYDELERQAMEQYRTSEESLALRYQELEQQAMEQYRNVGSCESINTDLENRPTKVRTDRQSNVNHEDEINFECPSGFGKPNLSKKVHVVDNRGNEIQRQIKILKPENKAATNVHRASSEGSLRPIAVPRRYNGRESKNTCRGASGEKVVKTSSLSSLKRRLMPMSPVDRTKSGSTLIKNPSSLDPIKTVQSLDKHVAAYYRNTKFVQAGAGDTDTINAGMWLADFWS